MLASLSLRNMKRQLSEYKIYWLSLIGVVALMYAFNSLIVSPTMQQLFSLFAESGNSDIGVIATLFSIVIVFALGWFVSYMMDFILQRRSKEISTYMILGVEKSDICKMIFKENTLFGLLALIVGFGFGILVSKILENFVLNLFNFQESLLDLLSIKAVGLTCIEFCIVYIIALIKTDRKVQKVKLIDLLNYSRSNSSVHEHQSRAGLIFLLFSVVMLTLSFYSFAGTKQTVTNITIGAVSAMLGLLCFFRGFVYIIHEIFNKSRKWKYRGSHLVTLRMFLSKSEKMSFSLGVISILFTCTIVCIGMTNAFYQVMEKAVVMQPFDLAIVHVGENGDYSQYSSFLNERIDVSSQYSYCLYTDKSTRFTDTRNHLLTEYWNRAAKAVSVNDYVIAENQHDAFMKYSDYCNLRAMLGLPQISLAEGQYIIHCLPYLKDTFYANENKGAFNVYMGFLFWCVVFGVSVFFVLFSNYLLVIKERQKYKEENLFFFGQLLSKLKSKTLSMTLICLTLTLSMALFFVTPLLVGWAQGFLEKRVPFDIQISSDYIGMQSGYIGIQSEKELPVTDYSFLDSFIEKNISVRDDCSFKTYFVNKTDFYNQLENSRKNASPITAISLSDYNHLLKMAGYDEISLRDHEFTTQWLSITPQDSISAYLEAHKSIKTDGGDLQLADISAHTVDLGEDFYNFQSVIYIVPDHICNKLTSANTFRYMMADKTISYDIAQELKSYFENSSLTDSLVTYNITMRTIEVNDNSAIIFIMQTGLTYSAIILFVTCFTILALQQLSDSGKYKYRFRVLRNMGVEEPHIRKLILKQLAVWFGVPVILALILSGAFLVFLFVGFHMQIAVYIGVQRLVQQLLIVLAILGVLLISYFISTWVLFNKSASA